MYVHLHGHSHYSLLGAIGNVKAIVARAVDLGMDAVAITDYDGMHGALEFYEVAGKNDIKPLIWVDMWVMSVGTEVHRIALLAKSKQWYHNLISAISHAQMDKWYDASVITLNDLQQYSEDLLCIMGWLQSPIGKLVEARASAWQIEDMVGLYDNVFGEDNVIGEYTAQRYGEYAQLRVVNDAVLARFHAIWRPTVIHNNFHYVQESDRIAYHTALRIKDSSSVAPLWDFHIASESDIERLCRDHEAPQWLIRELMEMNHDIADRCNVEIELWVTRFPSYESPEEIVYLYEKHKESLIVDG